MRNPLAAGMIAVAFAFVAGLRLAFAVRGRVPRVPENVFGAGVALVIIGLAFGMMAIIYRGPWFGSTWRSHARGKASALPFQAEWDSAQAVYQANLLVTATCPHLMNIEAAMRASGIQTRLVTEAWREYSPHPVIKAECCVKIPELRGRLALPAPAQYQEGYQPERSEFDNPWGAFSCAQCQSRIEVTHSEWGRGKIPWFPL